MRASSAGDDARRARRQTDRRLAKTSADISVTLSEYSAKATLRLTVARLGGRPSTDVDVVELRAQADASMSTSNNLDVAKIYQVVT